MSYRYCLPARTCRFAEKAVEVLAAKGPLNWDLEDEKGYTPLMLAAYHDNVWLVKHLIDVSEGLVHQAVWGLPSCQDWFLDPTWALGSGALESISLARLIGLMHTMLDCDCKLERCMASLYWLMVFHR